MPIKKAPGLGRLGGDLPKPTGRLLAQARAEVQLCEKAAANAPRQTKHAKAGGPGHARLLVVGICKGRAKRNSHNALLCASGGFLRANNHLRAIFRSVEFTRTATGCLSLQHRQRRFCANPALCELLNEQKKAECALRRTPLELTRVNQPQTLSTRSPRRSPATFGCCQTRR